MQKGRIIKDIIGSVLELEGFEYNKSISKWGFLKEFKNSKGEIARQVVCFYPSGLQKKLIMSVNNFSGGYDSYHMNNFVPDCTNNGIKYEREEDFKQVVESYAEILKQYGLELLHKLEEPKRIDYFRQEDYDTLFENSDILAQKYMEEDHIDIVQITLEEAVNRIKEEVRCKQTVPFEECRDLFLELAAFYKEVLDKTLSCEWKMYDYITHQSCILEIQSEIESSVFVTKEIHFAWKKGVERLDELLIEN